VAVVVLVLLLAINVVGLLFLAYAWFMGAHIHLRDGPLTVVLGVAIVALCIKGIRALAHSRIRTASLHSPAPHRPA
jgi:hypothetical protein